MSEGGARIHEGRSGESRLRRLGVLALAGTVAAALFGGCRARPEGPPFTGEPYLLVWAGDADRRDSDFLAVIDAHPESKTYGTVVLTVPVGSAGNEPHAMERTWGPDGLVFAGGLLTSRTFVFDVREPPRARLAYVDTPTPTRRYATPRAYLRLKNGHRVATFGDQRDYRGGALELLYEPGGLVEFDGTGRFLRELDAADPKAAGLPISPHGIALSRTTDRLVTTDAGHGYTPAASEWVPGVSVQVREATSGRLVETLPLGVGERADENLGPRTVQLLDRSSIALVSTREGGALYASLSLGTSAAAFDLVHDFGAGSLPGDAVVAPNGRYYLQALTGANRIDVLDVSEPRQPRRVGSLRVDRDPAPPHEPRAGGPHGLAIGRDGTRVAVCNYSIDVPASRRDGDRRVYLLHLDPESGKAAFDLAFRDEVSGAVGVDFNRTRWPHGDTGPARPAAALFVAPLPPPRDRAR
jgi:hypothetical protein